MSLTKEEKLRLKIDLLQAVPNDPNYTIKSVLQKYNLQSISHALQTLKAKSLTELRGGHPDLTKILRALNLRLVKNILYSPKNRGRYDVNRQLHLSPENLEKLLKSPKTWLSENAQEVKKVCFMRISSGRNEKICQK